MIEIKEGETVTVPKRELAELVQSLTDAQAMLAGYYDPTRPHYVVADLHHARRNELVHEMRAKYFDLHRHPLV